MIMSLSLISKERENDLMADILTKKDNKQKTYDNVIGEYGCWDEMLYDIENEEYVEDDD